ncbi:MAG TPA: hypothetical protein PK765_07010 [bacterium]|nr:hypothetical protein [bacterium]
MTDSERVRFQENPLDIFSFESPDIRELLMVAPKIADFLKKDSKEYLANMREYLGILGVETVADDAYYADMPFFTGPVWKIELRTDEEDGSTSWRMVGSGGRFDDLARRVGQSKAVPAV